MKRSRSGAAEADRNSIRSPLPGSLSSNIHGRGLRFPPFRSGHRVSSGSSTPMGACGCAVEPENRELLALAIGGYGLFGVVTRVTIRLVPSVQAEEDCGGGSPSGISCLGSMRVNSRMVSFLAIVGTPRSTCMVERSFTPELSRATDQSPMTPLFLQRSTQMASSDWAGLYRLARTKQAKGLCKLISSCALGTYRGRSTGRMPTSFQTFLAGLRRCGLHRSGDRDDDHRGFMSTGTHCARF